MVDAVSRRGSLTALCGVLAATAGCLSSIGRPDDPACPDGDVGVRAESISDPTAENDTVHPIRAENLSEDGREILLTAIEDGEYTECFPGSDAFESLEDQAYDQLREREHGDDTVYAVYEDDYYSLGLWSRDETIP